MRNHPSHKTAFVSDMPFIYLHVNESLTMTYSGLKRELHSEHYSLVGDERQSYHCTICNDRASLVGQSFNSTLDAQLLWLALRVPRHRSFPWLTLSCSASNFLFLPLPTQPPAQREFSVQNLTLFIHHHSLILRLGQVLKQF